MILKEMEQHAWLPNRLFLAQNLVIGALRECEGRLEKEIDIEAMFSHHPVTQQANFTSIRQTMMDQGWLKPLNPAASSTNRNTFKMTEEGRKVALSLSRISQKDRERNYILLLVYALVDGSTAEDVFSTDLAEIAVIDPKSTKTYIDFWVEERCFRMEAQAQDGGLVYLTSKGVRYCEDLDKDKPAEVFTPMQNIQTFNFHGATSNFAIGDKTKITVTNSTGLSGDEVADLIAEVRDTLSSMQAQDRETLETLLRHIGNLSEDPETEREAESVAKATRSWLEKISGKVTEKVTVDSIIALGKVVLADQFPGLQLPE